MAMELDPTTGKMEFTAQDVVYNLHRYSGSGSGFTEPGAATPIASIPFEPITASDDSTVVIKLTVMVLLYPAIWWGWTPPLQWVPFTEDPLGNLGVLIIPSLILGTYLSASTMRMIRTTMLEVLRQDYVRTAWSVGAACSAERAASTRRWRAVAGALARPVPDDRGLQPEHVWRRGRDLFDPRLCGGAGRFGAGS